MEITDLVSFASRKKCKYVDSVQFIMKTENIRVLEKKQLKIMWKKKSIWDKIKDYSVEKGRLPEKHT